MRKKLLSLLALALCTASNMWALDQVDGVYQIGTAQDLADFATLVNGGTFTSDAVLTADIDMSTLSSWTAIGDWSTGSGSNACYKGHFDGQGHKITGFHGTASHNYYGIFGVISSCLIENFSVYGTISTSVATMGGVAGYARDATPTIRNVHSYVDINNTANGKRVGGILGTSHNGTVVVDRCTYSGTLDGKDSAGNGNYGGIVGYVNNSASAKLQVTNCLFDGILKNTASTPGSCTLGGIIGYVGANITDMAIKNCLSIGTVTSKVTGQFYGAVKSAGATIVNSYYMGDNVNGSASTVTLTATKLENNDARLTGGELCYLLNESVSGGTNWYQTLSTDDYPLPYGTDKVYANGSYNCDMTPKEGTTVTYSNTEGAIVDPHSYIDGICSYCGGPDETYMTANSEDYYEIGTSAQLKWFAAFVNAGNPAAKGKLTADIDLTGVTIQPIGNANGAFTGEFDGQGKAITNYSYTATTTHNGLFGYIDGTAMVKDFSISGTLSSAFTNTGTIGLAKGNSTIKGIHSSLDIDIQVKGWAGGIVGGADGNVTVEECWFDGTFDTHNFADAKGGIVGYASSPTIKNCLFSGIFTGEASQHYGGILGYVNSNAFGGVQNCLSMGSVTTTNSNHSYVAAIIGNMNSNTKVSGITNNYWLTGSSYAGYSGVKAGDAVPPVEVTAEQLASGEICYLLNGDQTEIAWYQTIGTNDEPTLDATNARVYVNGTVCPDTGTPQGTVSYSNADGTTVGTHNYVDGFCSYCDFLDATYITPVDGYYEIGNEKQLKWFAAFVNDNHFDSNAKLTTDIDLNGVTWTPIGNGSNKYTGTFDGQGFAISNFSYTATSNYNGLFGFIDGATVKNFSISGELTSNGFAQNGVIGQANGTSMVSCIYSALTINVSNCSSHTGGIVGGTDTASHLLIEECEYSGTMTHSGTGDNQAGILGYTYSGGVKNCIFSGTIIGEGSKYGGILGYCKNPSFLGVQNCLAIGKIQANDGNTTAAAIIANWNGGETANVKNNYYKLQEGSTTTIAIGNRASSCEAPVEVTTEQLASGYVTAKLGYAFHQNLGSDANPTLNKTKGYVTQIGAAGYSTQYITDSDVTIPSGVEAFAGVVNESSITLNSISGAIAAGEPVVLRGAAGFYNFMPTTGATPAASNDLQGSDGTTKGGDGIYALAKKDDVVGFYPVSSSVTIPAGRAYLESASDVKAFYGIEDNATSIQTIDNGQQTTDNGAIYNVAGQRLNKVQKGINIVNGKKVLF